jgi:hypothetical protein
VNENLDADLLVSQFHDCIALAKRAKATIDRSRGQTGTTFRDAIRLWDAATQNAIRISRALRLANVAPDDLDAELKKLVES